MSTLRQPCPECGRTLELPADAVGRAAKCPACNATFTIAKPAEVAETHSEAPVTPPPPPDPTLPPQPSPISEPVSTPETTPTPEPAPTAPQPIDGANPFSSPLGAGTVSGSAPNASFERAAVQPVSKHGEIAIVQRSIEEIFTPTISIFTARWAPLIVAFILVLFGVLLLGVLPVLALTALADAGGEEAAGVILLLGAPLFGLFSVYVWVGITRVAIAVARNDPNPIGELLPPFKVVVRLIIGGLVMGVGTLVVIVLYGGALGILGAAGAPQPLMAALGVFGIVIAILFLMVIQWLLWPWVYVVSDGKATALASIRVSYLIVMSNKLTSLLLLVIAMVMSMVGSAACYVGHFVTMPLTMLMFAIAYLLMTNQPIHSPNAVNPPHQPLPPSQPTL